MNKRILLCWLIGWLSDASLAGSEILYTKDRIVVVNNKQTQSVVAGKTYFKADIYFLWQQNFFYEMFIPGWCLKFRMEDFAQLSRVWIPSPKPWVLLNITEEQYRYWIAHGVLKTQAEIDAEKAVQEAKAAIQAAAAMASIIMYIDPADPSVYHWPACRTPGMVQVDLSYVLAKGLKPCGCTE